MVYFDLFSYSSYETGIWIIDSQQCDSRGLARALTGNITGVIEDFQTFVDGADNKEVKAQRQQWIAALQQGANPFTPEGLEGLK